MLVNSIFTLALGCLLSQLTVGFKFDQLHQIFNDQIALKFFAFLFYKRTVLQKSRTANLGKELQANRDVPASFVIAP